jgi:DNA-binding IclR family transcriptional regulator
MGTTSIGHAYLWALAPRQQRSLIAELKRRAGARAAAVDSSIRESFEELEETGTCGVLGGFQRDAYGVALPVFVGRDRVLMGLSCGKAEVQPDLAAQRKRIAPVLKEAAAQFEARMARFDGWP